MRRHPANQIHKYMLVNARVYLDVPHGKTGKCDIVLTGASHKDASCIWRNSVHELRLLCSQLLSMSKIDGPDAVSCLEVLSYIQNFHPAYVEGPAV